MKLLHRGNRYLARAFTLLVILLSCINAAHAAQTITYFHTDALGSVVAASDQSGELLWRKGYSPYGEKIKDGEGKNNAIAYTGKPHDDVTGLTYMGARYYDPEVGRFMGMDPVGFSESNPMMFNRYAYANNNPYKFVDPDGNSPVDKDDYVKGYTSGGFSEFHDRMSGDSGLRIGVGDNPATRLFPGGGRSGQFNIVDWKGYPKGVPKPKGPVKLIKGAEYNAARKAANSANKKIRKNNNLTGKPVDVHEVKPVKFSGSPTDSANKLIVDRGTHRKQLTPFWNKLKKDVGG